MANEYFDGMTSNGTTYEVVDQGARAGVSALQTALASLQSALDTLMGTDDITDEIDTYNEIKDFLDGFDVNDPTLVNQLLVLSNAIAAKYTKPETGIPASDLAGDIPLGKLAGAIQTSLEKADTALQQKDIDVSYDANTKTLTLNFGGGLSKR